MVQCDELLALGNESRRIVAADVVPGIDFDEGEALVGSEHLGDHGGREYVGARAADDERRTLDLSSTCRMSSSS